MKENHILTLSGGKDSAALALHIKNNYPDIHEKIQYCFCDTELEVPEVYEYLNKLELYLNKPILFLKPQNRWCTVELKTKTMQNFIKKLTNENQSIINLYIGIRADEAQRVKTATSNNPSIREQFLFVTDGLIKKDIIEILNNSGLGLPRYMEWKSRSGCFFCFYQSKLEWINLYERHPELYKKAMDYEFKNCKEIKNGNFGWRSDITLEEMIKPENIKKIKEYYAQKTSYKNIKKINTALIEII